MNVSGSRILVVDGNAVNLSILSEQMSSWNFKHEVASSGAAALVILKSAPERNVMFDAIILDYHMPAMTGSEVVSALKLDPALSDIPIIMLTSVDQAENGEFFNSLDIQGHLVKPARSSLLLETLIEVLQGDSGRNQKYRHENYLTEISNASNESQPSARTYSGPVVEGDIDVLVCEDNPVNQLVFEQILLEAGVKFVIANDGIEGVELYKKHLPKLVLMDVSMPQMNGLDATRAIREIEAETNNHVPIIGVTAHALTGDMDKCLDAGMDDYLPKPVSPKLTIGLARIVPKWLVDRVI